MRWTLTAAGPLLVVAALIGKPAVTYGFVFGLCIGLLNFDLMARFNAALMGGSGSRVAVFGMLVRFGVIFAGAIGVWWKQWNFIAAGTGCFLVYPVLFVHGILMGRHRATVSAETKG
ncbi:MAG: hypothetical protein JW889_03745 [Verrucomicrobia bacterium]|nr:hypothetical protein [Verrucomicrobiota bacterium]